MNVIQNLPKKTICKICKIARQHKLFQPFFAASSWSTSLEAPPLPVHEAVLLIIPIHLFPIPSTTLPKSTLHCVTKKNRKTKIKFLKSLSSMARMCVHFVSFTVFVLHYRSIVTFFYDDRTRLKEVLGSRVVGHGEEGEEDRGHRRFLVFSIS